ncbi:MAG TPA: glycosyltransferase family A protein [Puia sp.]|jgi:glycosyltransferase involved in cell wall biosynthesis
MSGISVIIPTYKRKDKLKRALVSALEQSMPAREIIVVDDNRDEAESAAVKECVASFNDPRLLWMPNFRKPGGCGARNAGIVTAKGEFIAFLDDDDVLLPGALQAHFSAFDASVGMVYGNCQVVDDLYKVTETTAFGKAPLHFSDLIMGECPPSSSVVMARRSALLDAGLFDESLPSFQDYDMWLKVAQRKTIMSHEGLVAKFIQHDGQRTSINFDKRRAGLDLIVEKWSPDIKKVRSVKSFINHFMAGAYFNSGAFALSLGHRHRVEAVRYFLRALRLKFFSRRYWKWTVFGLLGFQLTKKIRSIHP